MAITRLLRYWYTYKNINRVRQIVNVFLKHGFGQFIEQINLTRFIPLSKRIKFLRKRQEVERHTIASRLRVAFSELGPSFIKLAQILSSRPDLITPEYADEFKKLQDRVPAFSFETVSQTIGSELNNTLDDLFPNFDKEPVAAASIAQVHNAVLKTGEKVIVKIQRPDIRNIIERDIIILGALARLMLKYIPESRFFDPEGIVDEFAKTVRRELDFRAEAKNAQRFKKNFDERDDVYIPDIHSSLLSDRVIVMERLEGVRIDDMEGIDSYEIERSEVAKRGVDIYFKMIFEDGFFHADPHPGNIFVLTDGRIGLMDFGMVGWLTPEMMDSVAGACLAVLNRNYDRLVDIYLEELGLVSERFDVDILRKEFKSDLIYLLEPLYGLTISEINFAESLEAITGLVIKHNLKVPTDLLLMNKTILILDNIGRQLDPDFSAVIAAQPYAEKLVKKRLSPQALIDKTRDNLTDMSNLLVDTPKQMNRMMKKVLRDEMSFKIDPIGMDKLITDIDRSSNRLAFSIVVASIIVGSSMLVQSGIGGTIFGLPVIGAIGFLVAFLLGLRLLISIIKSGRL